MVAPATAGTSIASATAETSVAPAAATAEPRPAGAQLVAESSLQESNIEVSSDRITFGSVSVGGPESGMVARILTIRNAGDDSLAIERTTIAGPNVSSFEILSGGGQRTLASGESVGIVVGFAPTSAGNATANLRVETADGSSATVDLFGTGVAPDIEIESETLRFENETDGPVTEDLTLTNVGDAPLTIRAISIVGPNRTAFEQDVSVPLTLEPDQSRTVTVSFDPPDSGPRFATLHVMSDDPDEPQRNVWLTNTPMVADVSPSTVLADRTIVNVSVSNAQANASQSVNVSWPLTRDDAVAIDSLTFTPERSADFTINVTKSSERFEGTPPFNLTDGTEDVAFVSMNSTIADEDLRNVTVVFRVRKDQLDENETGPEDVTLYTRQNGTWSELPTQLIDESSTHYFFRASASGLADFATGIKQAKFRIDDAVVSITEIRAGENVDVLVRVTNVGGADGTYVVRLIRSDTVIDRRELTIAPNGTRQTSFTQSFDQPGTYELYVNDRFVGNVSVNESENDDRRVGPG